jgi:hypothetical protein
MTPSVDLLGPNAKFSRNESTFAPDESGTAGTG